jgi:hypothetical protein
MTFCLHMLQILPLITEPLLQQDDLGPRYVSLVTFMVETYPER